MNASAKPGATGAHSRRSALAARLLRWLGLFEARSARRWAIAAALALIVPSMFSGLAFDDYILLDELARNAGPSAPGNAPYDLFRWLDPEHVRTLIDGGGLAFWTFERTSITFLRPVTSLTHALDGLLWPQTPWAMHAHSMLWFALLLGLAARFYAALLRDAWVAGVATAMFALDSAHGVPVGWVANRNALVAGVFGFAALSFHHRSRVGASRRFALAAWLCAACSVFSAELALGVFGYLLCYALILEQGPIVPRVRSLVPYACVFALLLAARLAGHYVVYGLGSFVDPLREPGAFLAALPARVLVLLTSQVSRLTADLYQLATGWQPFYLAAGAIVCGLCTWFAWPSLRARRELRFLAAGAICSALPLVAAAPSDRLLTFVGLGVMPVLATILHDALLDARASDSPARLPARARGGLAFGVALALVHLVIDPMLLPATALWMSSAERALEVIDASLPRDAALASRAVIVTEVPDSLLVSYLPAMRAYKGEAPIGKLYWLVGNTTQAQFQRLGANSLRVTTQAGFFSDAWNERNSRFPLHAGDHIALSEMTISIVEVTADGRPLVCDFVFARSLEAQRYLWLRYDSGRLTSTRPPAGMALGVARAVR